MQRTFYAILVWFVSTLFVVYAFSLNSAGAVFADAIKTSLHANDVGVSIAAGSFIFGFACMQIPAGYLLDRYNPRFIVSAGVLLLALGNVLISYSDNLVMYCLANLIQGMGASFDFIVACILISQWFPAKMFPILSGLIETLAFICAALIHYGLVMALNLYSWQSVYQYLSLMGFGLFIATLLIIKSPPGYLFKNTVSLKQSLKMVGSNSQTWFCTIAAAMSFGVLLAFGGLWFLSAQTYYGMSSQNSLWIGGMIFLGIGLGTPLWGWISNKVKSRKMILYITLLLGNMCLLLMLYLPHYDMNSLLIIESISFLTGFFLSGSILIYTMVSEMSSNNIRGVAISITNSAVFLANSLVLLIPYLFITTYSKTFFTYLWVLPFCILIAILLVYFLKETYAD